MYRKLALPVVLAVLFSLMVSSVALAQDDQPEQLAVGRGRGIGQVTAIGEGQFTVQDQLGQLRPIRVDERTRYRSLDWRELAFDDLKVGSWVAGVLVRQQDRGLLARLVISLPEGYDLSLRLGGGSIGIVKAVDLAANEFALESRGGEMRAYVTNENTVMRGGAQHLDELEVGMIAQVVALRQLDGEWLAVAINTRKPLVRLAGWISAVDMEAGTFNLTTGEGEVLAVRLNEATRYRSLRNHVKSLQDLKPGMRIWVGAEESSDGSYQAKLVVAMQRTFRAPFRLPGMP